MEKYQKISEENSAYRPSNSRASRPPSRHKPEDQYWQNENSNAVYSYPYFVPPMPMPWIPSYDHVNPYPSWDSYDARAHSSSYFRPSHNIMQLQKDQHLNNHMSKTVSIIGNRSGAQGTRKRWSSKFTVLKKMVVRLLLQSLYQMKKSQLKC